MNRSRDSYEGNHDRNGRVVDEAHRLVVRDAEKWKLHKISKPAVRTVL
jgi:hypothetical protein